MFAPVELEDTLDTVLRLARRVFRCHAAGILLAADHGGLRAAASTDLRSERADQVQLDRREGPAVEATARTRPVLATELRFDGRWRFWAPLAADLGFRSSMSLGLVDDETVGALTLYSCRASFFDAGDAELSEAFVQHAATAIAIALERRLLPRGVGVRNVIGQAQGILMERYGVEAERALSALRSYAKQLDQDLEAVATDMVTSRALPSIGLSPVDAVAV